MLSRVRQPGAFRRFGHRLKWRFAWTLGAFGLGFGATFWYREHVFAWLIAPADGMLSPFDDGLPVFTAPTDMLGSTISLAMKGGVVVALPVLVTGIYTLISPALHPSLRRTLKIFLPAPVLLFLAGGAFVYYVMLPVGLKFLLNFGSGVAVPLITLKQYLDLLTALMIALGIVFELPLIMYLLSKLRIVSYRKFLSTRKFVPFAAIILGIILTPGLDLLTPALVAAPIVVLYEAGLFLAWLAHPEDGDYMGAKKVRAAVRWVYHKVRAIVTSPWRAARWVYRQVTRLHWPRA